MINNHDGFYFMNDILAKIFLNKIEFNLACMDRYQALSLDEKKEVLNEMKNHSDISIYPMYKDSEKLNLSVFFAKEYFKHNIENFNNSPMYDDLLNYICFFALNNEKDNFILKKEMLNLFNLTKKINFNIPSYSLIHSLSVNNDINTIQYAVFLGANIHLIDEANDSLASSSLYLKENIKVFNFIINQPNFNPNLGENVLSLALNNNYEKALNAIIHSSNHLLSNKEFIENAKIKSHTPSKIEELILLQYEKVLLEEKISDKSFNKKIKL